jgi:FixJ family two-component response regulator
VFLTAAVKKDEVNSHQGRIGGLPFIAKPVDLQEVVESIESVYCGSQVQRQACANRAWRYT